MDKEREPVGVHTGWKVGRRVSTSPYTGILAEKKICSKLEKWSSAEFSVTTRLNTFFGVQFWHYSWLNNLLNIKGDEESQRTWSNAGMMPQAHMWG